MVLRTASEAIANSRAICIVVHVGYDTLEMIVGRSVTYNMNGMDCGNMVEKGCLVEVGYVRVSVRRGDLRDASW